MSGDCILLCNSFDYAKQIKRNKVSDDIVWNSDIKKFKLSKDFEVNWNGMIAGWESEVERVI